MELFWIRFMICPYILLETEILYQQYYSSTFMLNQWMWINEKLLRLH